MVYTPAGKLVVVEKPYCIEVWMTDSNGELDECVSFTEFNLMESAIVTYGYTSGQDDYTSKSVFKSMLKNKEGVA